MFRRQFAEQRDVDHLAVRVAIARRVPSPAIRAAIGRFDHNVRWRCATCLVPAGDRKAAVFLLSPSYGVVLMRAQTISMVSLPLSIRLGNAIQSYGLYLRNLFRPLWFRACHVARQPSAAPGLADIIGGPRHTAESLLSTDSCGGLELYQPSECRRPDGMGTLEFAEHDRAGRGADRCAIDGAVPPQPAPCCHVVMSVRKGTSMRGE